MLNGVHEWLAAGFTGYVDSIGLDWCLGIVTTKADSAVFAQLHILGFGQAGEAKFLVLWVTRHFHFVPFNHAKLDLSYVGQDRQGIAKRRPPA
jgi:hypothetical protein